MNRPALPSLALADWRATRDSLQTCAQLLGKLRRAMAPAHKHWFHITLRAGAAGLVTPPFEASGVTLQLELVLPDARLRMRSSRGDDLSFPITGHSAADLRERLLAGLAQAGAHPALDPQLFTASAPLVCDAAQVRAFWAAFVRIDAVLRRFRATLREETGPVQLWPHHFDLALLWFTGRRVPGVDPADEESADEQMNFGFSTGDDTTPEPYFYVTAYPLPDGFVGAPLVSGARWSEDGFTGALLRYEDLRRVADPEEHLLAFLCGAQSAGKRVMTG